jgi:hypothetical protein
MRAVGNRALAMRSIRSQVMPSFWLRRFNMRRQRLTTCYRNAEIALKWVGTE